MQAYVFGSDVFAPDHPQWHAVLKKAHTAGIRPVCLCVKRDNKPCLYVALVNGQYILKRLPYSGSLHAPHCDHYEPPPELSGLGQVAGTAIREEDETHTTHLSLDFALSKGRSRQPSAGSAVEHESVRSDGTKLTMRGLLHYLFDEAGLTRWSPAMQGRRSWYVVRRELLKAAASKTTKGHPLPSILYVPEPFSSDRAEELKQRRRQSLSRLHESASARMLLLGELKAIEDARYGKCFVVKHMPDAKLTLSDDLHNRLMSRFGHQLQMWAQLESSHLLTLASISRSPQGVLQIEAACLMNVNDQWLPFESMYEWELLGALLREQRRFTKGLRYNLPSTKPLASAVLQDVGSVSVALFVVPQPAIAQYDEAIDELMAQSMLQAWKWHTDTSPMPELPPPWDAHQAYGAQRAHVQDGRAPGLADMS